MQDPVTKYLSRVKRELGGSNASKQKLLKGVHGQIREFVGVGAPCSFEFLCYELGDPKDVAIQLMESLDPEEIEVVRNRRKTIIAASMFAFAFVIFGMFFLLHQANKLNPDETQVIVILYDEDHPQSPPGGIENE